MSAHDEPVVTGEEIPAEGAAPDGLIRASDVPGVGDTASAALQDAEPTTPVPESGAPAEPEPAAAAERRALLELLIYAWDRARSPGVWERLTTGLAAVGVSVERPDGAPFDPARHEVGGVQSTDDPALVDTVAETEVVGFTDRGTVLREPIVVVYRRA